MNKLYPSVEGPITDWSGLMFQAPSKGTTYTAPAEPIDVDQRYLFRLIKIEDEGVSKFADPAKGETFHNLRWHMRIADAETKTPVLDTEGAAWEHVQWTSNKTGKNPKNGMIATARAWIEAFLGHPVEDEDITPTIVDDILDKVAAGFFTEKEVVSQTGEAYTKLVILKLGPYKAGKAEPPASKPAAPPASAAAAGAAIPF